MEIERLSATDEAFLAIEDRELPMHVGALMVFAGDGALRPGGGLDVDALRARIAIGVASEPRFRQRLVRVPGLGTAWVEDPRFDLERHIGHVALPRPGGRSELMTLAGRLFAPPMRRARPLWEMWVIEGLEDGRFALLLKAHHAMVDGVAGIGMLASLLETEPDASATRAIARREVPAISELAVARALATDRAQGAKRAFVELRDRARDPARTVGEARTMLSGMAHTLRDGLAPAPRTVINPDSVSPRRSFTGVRLDFERARRVRRALGGTINDVALSTVTGALRRYLSRRGERLDALSRFRALVPVDLRSRAGAQDAKGNQVSFVIAPLPVHEADVRARHAAVVASTARLKTTSHEIESTALVEHLSDVAIPHLVDVILRIAMHLLAFNVVVTNVPGPPMPLYLGTARIEEVFGLVPLFAHQGLGIVVLSYAGGLFIGIHADADAMPDADTFARDLEDALEELTTAPADAG